MDDLISRLSELRCQYNCFDENERDAYHTLSEAIKALSDVPDTNVGDTISRQAAIKALCKAGCDSGHCGVSCPDVMAIEHLPSADVQPVRHGRWIKHDVVKMLYDGRTLDGFVTCNKCQSVYALEAMEWAYCPMCGSHNWEGQYN